MDAGVQLSAINSILQETQPAGLGEAEGLSLPHTLTTGPFAGLEIQHRDPLVNAGHLFTSLIDTWLITHAHLDHICGFVLNTAGLPGTRPKTIAALPHTIAALKTHIFNSTIWPNLSDENGGAGLVTFMRLVEGGSPAMGDGESKGYVEVNDGLAIKCWGVSHGHHIERHQHRGSASGASGFGRRNSVEHAPFGTPGMGMGSSIGMLSPRAMPHHSPTANSVSSNPALTNFLQQQHLQQHHFQQQHQQREHMGGQSGVPLSAAGNLPAGSSSRPGSFSGPGTPYGESVCVYDSSAYFIRDIETGREILVFGDVEPDSISLYPRNLSIWLEAAPKIASGKLAAIFIECSYDDSQSVDRLYGHLTPRFVDEEMRVLAREVDAVRSFEKSQAATVETSTTERRASGEVRGFTDKKRKRHGSDVGALLVRRKTGELASTPVAQPTSNPHQNLSRLQTEESVSPKTTRVYSVESPSSTATDSPHLATPTGKLSLGHDVDISGTPTPPYLDSLPVPPTDPTKDTPHISTPAAELNLKDIDMSGPDTLALTHQSREGTADHDTDVGDAESVPPAQGQAAIALPLQGLKVVIIHIKDRLNGARSTGEVVFEQLTEHEEESKTGVEYLISYRGQSLYL